jgi:hypothetical protein
MSSHNHKPEATISKQATGTVLHFSSTLPCKGTPTPQAHPSLQSVQHEKTRHTCLSGSVCFQWPPLNCMGRPRRQRTSRKVENAALRCSMNGMLQMCPRASERFGSPICCMGTIWVLNRANTKHCTQYEDTYVAPAVASWPQTVGWTWSTGKNKRGCAKSPCPKLYCDYFAQGNIYSSRPKLNIRTLAITHSMHHPSILAPGMGFQGRHNTANSSNCSYNSTHTRSRRPRGRKNSSRSNHSHSCPQHQLECGRCLGNLPKKGVHQKTPQTLQTLQACSSLLSTSASPCHPLAHPTAPFCRRAAAPATAAVAAPATATARAVAVAGGSGWAAL